MKVRYDLIDKKISQLCEDFPKLVKPPVNLLSLMKKMDIRFEENAYGEELSGAAIFDGNSMIVTVNASEPKRRKRFTIAHEIGHLILHADQGLNVDIKPIRLNRDQSSSTGDMWREVEANYFAASLLMPEEDVQKQYRDLSERDEDEVLSILAKRYDVSIQAISVRLNTLGLVSF